MIKSTMSDNTKSGSDNISCVTNAACDMGTAVVNHEPISKANNRADLNFSNHLVNSSLICQQNVQSSKIVRIFTVLAYIVAVSTAAILLSIYYTFIWNPYEHLKLNSYQTNNSSNDHVDQLNNSDLNSIKKLFPLPYSMRTDMPSMSKQVHNLRTSDQPAANFIRPWHGTIISTQSPPPPQIALNKTSTIEYASPVRQLLLSSFSYTGKHSGALKSQPVMVPSQRRYNSNINSVLMQADTHSMPH